MQLQPGRETVNVTCSAEWKVALQCTLVSDNTRQVYFPGYSKAAVMLVAQHQQAYLASETTEQVLSDGNVAVTEVLMSVSPHSVPFRVTVQLVA